MTADHTDHTYGDRNPPPPPNAPRRSRKWIVLVVAAVSVLGMLGLGLMLMVALVGAAAGGGMADNQVMERVVQSGDTDRTIAVISLSGPIMGSGSHISGQGTMYDVALQLRKAAREKDVRAVILQVDSPGGGLTASDILYNEVQRVQQAGKKVVVMVGNMAASGGYYVAAPADWIVATPTSLVGSFGVISMRFEFDNLMEKIGVQYEPIKSTGMKDLGSPFRDLLPEEREFFQDLLSTYHNRFVDIIARGRNLSEEKVRPLADGLVYTPDFALEQGLIDQIGYFDAALDKTRQMIGTANARVVVYERPFSLGRVLLGGEGGASLKSLLPDLATPRVEALWTAPRPEAE